MLLLLGEDDDGEDESSSDPRGRLVVSFSDETDVKITAYRVITQIASSSPPSTLERLHL